MTDGTVTQKTKYHCIAHEGPMQADELRVFYGQLWCSDCWHIHSKAGKRWGELDRFAAVPVAEQEPVAWARMKGGKVADAFADRKLAEFVAGFAVNKLVPLYLRPQPAEQQLDLHLFAKRMDEELEKHDIQGFEPVVLAVAEEVLGYEQQPAPDVSALVGALEAALMVMTSKEVRLEKQADAITMVRSQLAAHRNQGGES